MRLPRRYYQQIVAHAHRGKPNEVCGLIAGNNGWAVKLYETTNNDPRPRVRYNVEPSELLAVLREIEERQWQLMAIYHSHPTSEAYPSDTDVSLACYPDAVYIIVSLADDVPVVRAFKIVGKQIVEQDLVIEEETECASQTM